MIKKSILKEFIDNEIGNGELIVTYEFGDHKDKTFNIKVKNVISIEDKHTFVEHVAKNCFDQNGDYIPDYFDLAFEVTALQVLTDVKPYYKKVSVLDENNNETEEIKSVFDEDKTYILCQALDFINRIDDVKFNSLIKELKKCCIEKINYLKSMKINGEREYLKSMEKDFHDSIEVISNMIENFNEATISLTKENSNVALAKELIERFNTMTDKELIEAFIKVDPNTIKLGKEKNEDDN